MGYAALPQQATKDAVQAAGAVRVTIRPREEGAGGRTCTQSLCVPVQPHLQCLWQRHQPVLAELPVKHHNDTLCNVDIRVSQPTDFSVSHTTAAQKAHDLGHHKLPVRGHSTCTDSVCRCKQGRDLFASEDERSEGLLSVHPSPHVRRVSGYAMSQQEPHESPDHARPVLLVA
jgi:hypothetical protein